MSPSVSTLQRFLHSHYFFGGVRHTVGIVVPVLVIGVLWGKIDWAMVAAAGALAIAIIDQPGGPRRYRRNEMLAGTILGTLTVILTGLASPHTTLIWFVVPLLCFALSMLTVFGKRGGIIGFACLLLMTLAMRTPLEPGQVALYALVTLGGGVFYLCFSILLARLRWHRELQQTLSVALFATADYIQARAQFYDVSTDLEEAYRTLIHRQSTMVDLHQAARDMVLRELPDRSRAPRETARREALLHLFLDMVQLLDSLIATHTDYATLRRTLGDGDAMLFARDALRKLSSGVARIALDVSRNSATVLAENTRAELRALEYELERYRRRGFNRENPETYAILVQVLRRLRNASTVVQRMAGHTGGGRGDAVSPASRTPDPEKSFSRFLNRSELRFSMLTSNFRRDSSNLRYALRVALAAFLGMVVSAGIAHILADEGMPPALNSHGYWIILTIIVVMKPGFALTRQRNGRRLAGTLIGCGLAFLLFRTTQNSELYFGMLIASSILGTSLVQLNYMAAAIFNTLFVLIGFHFLSPETGFVIGERLVDTILGCAIALLCSYVFPWWEHSAMPGLARSALAANRNYLNTGLRYAALRRKTKTGPEVDEAHLAWQLARKNADTAFSNLASAFYRMMDEPAIRQGNVPELNHLIIQNHALASQIGAAVPILAEIQEIPESVRQTLDAIVSLLDGRDIEPPPPLSIEPELAHLIYPLRQMLRAAEAIRHEMRFTV